MLRHLRSPLLVILLVVLAGCTGEDEANIAPPTTEGGSGGAGGGGGQNIGGTGAGGTGAIAWREHPTLGAILVDEQGRTLYVFTDDGENATTCLDQCAANWPPANASGVGAVTDASLAARLSSMDRGDGTMQLAIDGRPLYRFVGDAAAGDANGQGRNGKWYVIRQSDEPGQLNVDFLDGPGGYNVTAENVTYGDGAQGFLARPEGEGTFPGVVMIHEWWGLNEHIRTMAQALAAHGYTVLAIDLFNGTVATTPDEAQAQVEALDQEKATAQMRQAVTYLREERNATRVASLGWCFGGGQSLQLALSGEPLNATVIYYGDLVIDKERLAAIDWPVLGIFGAEDDTIPVEDVRAFEQALRNQSVEVEVHVYEGAGHAFANPSRGAFSPQAAMDAWSRTLAFLERHLQA